MLISVDFPAPFLSKQSVHLAGLEVDVDLVERPTAGEDLAQPTDNRHGRDCGTAPYPETVGKSSMIRLVRGSLERRAEGKRSDFVFVEFNA